MVRGFVWTVPTRVVAAPGRGAEVVAAMVGTAPALVVGDAAVRDRAELLATHLGCETHEVSTPCDFGAVDRLAALVSQASARVVVAVGGGTVMDLARVAALAAADRSLAGPDGWPGEGLRGRAATSVTQAAPAVVAVPSTVGTGAEVSSLAVVAEAGRTLRAVLADPGLHPRAAVLDVEMLRSLPRQLVRDGLLETAARALGPALADDGAHPAADEFAAVFVRRAMALSAKVGGGRAGTVLPDRVLAEAAWLATSSATQLASVGRTVSDSPLWLLQHAVTGSSGQPKAAALRALLPVLLERVTQQEDVGPLVTPGRSATLASLITGPVGSEVAGARALHSALRDCGLLDGPSAAIDPQVHAADLVEHGFTRKGALEGQSVASLAHAISPSVGSQPS
ncbi:iron-containing alcohol dehydrogenase [Ornithinimicrobium pratense]|uniref:iron-containing alcohol dehydrogenase n=1 Tax=Ornithinimicrobium pratense TaxID=2593973 RepID=UPI001787F07A|nr:iron-containing alcohol dehydrogenase [Ornithinimicrobium pratense]